MRLPFAGNTSYVPHRHTRLIYYWYFLRIDTNVETFVLEDNEEIMKLAIEKESNQVEAGFLFTQSCWDNWEWSERNFQSLPEISIGILHGQLGEEEVEETIMDFNNRKYDLMVTTTIIESGNR